MAMQTDSNSEKERKKKVRGRQFPNDGELKKIYLELMKKPNVWCCFIGRKEIKGEPQPGLSIVCGVHEKFTETNLSQKERIPKSIKCMNFHSSSHSLKTDVIQMSPKLTFHQDTVYFGPGDGIKRIKDNSRATIGIALNHPDFGPVVTTAGHLFEEGHSDNNEDVLITSGSKQVYGKKVRHINSIDADYALIQINENRWQQSENLFKGREIYRVGPFVSIGKSDLNKIGYILTQTTSRIQTTIKGIHAYCNFGNGIIRTDLILTDPKTNKGDSGACLVTEKYAVSGLLVGQIGISDRAYSAFLPAYIPATREFASLI